jgi:DNA-binding XRE family transcriptional regulator
MLVGIKSIGCLVLKRGRIERLTEGSSLVGPPEFQHYECDSLSVALSAICETLYLMQPQEIFGNNVRKLRENKGWSQETLAEKAELHRTYVSGIERGVRNPTLTIVFKLAAALAVRPGVLTDERGCV